jgi:hypothetical protein
MGPTELRPQCGRIWKFVIKLSAILWALNALDDRIAKISLLTASISLPRTVMAWNLPIKP